MEENQRQLLRTLRTEVDSRTKSVVESSLSVPNLIGEYCQFQTFSDFMETFHKKVNDQFIEIK